MVNIWMPREDPPPGKLWPVLAWIHGGWLQMGNPSITEKNKPHEMIAEDGGALRAVVVSIGYRLNIFGFLAGDGVAGNFGFWVSRCLYFHGKQDQRYACSGWKHCKSRTF